ncbi:MAG: O-antigen ligase family protein [Pseudomonadota bacterium]|nr:O-antigen ligase family protein [Pseudomonadota bacterium]MDP2351051.1 O-antigen ligase family protein [Pseudomonadota bacterium]
MALARFFLFLYVTAVYTISGDTEYSMVENMIGYGLVAVFAIHWMHTNKKNILKNREYKIAIIFLLFCFISLLVGGVLNTDANMFILQFSRYITLVQVIGLSYIAFYICIESGDVRPLEYGLYAGVFMNIIMLVFFSVDVAGEGREGGGVGAASAMGFALSISAFVAYSRISIILRLGKLNAAQNLHLLVLVAVIAGALYINLFWTGSRTGIILCGFVMLAVIVQATINGIGKLRFAPLALVGILAMVAVYTLPMLADSRFLLRFANISSYFTGAEFVVREQSVILRAEMIEKGISLWQQSPVFGWGFDAFRHISGYGTYSHSNHVELLANYGLIGYIMYYSIYISLVFSMLKHSKTNSNVKDLKVTILLLVGLVFIAGISNVSYYSKFNWLVIAYMSSMLMLAIRMHPPMKINNRFSH